MNEVKSISFFSIFLGILSETGIPAFVDSSSNHIPEKLEKFRLCQSRYRRNGHYGYTVNTLRRHSGSVSYDSQSP